MQYGLTPLHDPSAEASVLSAALTDEPALAKVRAVGLTPEAFYVDSNRRLYEAACAVADDGRPVDITTVCAWLKDRDRLQAAGGVAYAAKLIDATPSVAHVEAHARIVIEKARHRRLGEAARLAVSGAEDARTPIEATIAVLQNAIDQAKGAAAPRASLIDELWTTPASVTDWLEQTPAERSYLLSRDGKGVLPRGKVGLLAAGGGVGKTMLLTSLAVAVASGRRWLGSFNVDKPGAVLLVLAEEDQGEAHRRIHAAAQAIGLDGPARVNVANRLVVLPCAGHDVSLTEATDNRPGALPRTRLAADMLDRLARDGRAWSLVVLDPLARFAGPDVETDNAAATRFVQVLEQLTAAPGSPTVLVSHHTTKLDRKNTGTRGAHDDTGARGASALSDAVRWHGRLFRRERGDDVPATTPEIVRFDVVKSNYGPTGHAVDLARSPESGVLEQASPTAIAAYEPPKKSQPAKASRGDYDVND